MATPGTAVRVFPCGRPAGPDAHWPRASTEVATWPRPLTPCPPRPRDRRGRAARRPLDDTFPEDGDPGVRVDPEIASLLPGHTAEEEARLEAKMLREGCPYPPVVRKGRGILLDGHLCLKLCRRHGLPYRDAAREWVLNHQRARHNLTPERPATCAARVGRLVV